ncbi:uncharacterized protein [Henckelia pumila]|uniref:uncharacterized protein n=1 Tax=Henckelia pumila TaxID=405737 RepID=UPI003C6E4476
MAPRKKQKKGASSFGTFDAHQFWDEEAAKNYSLMVSKSMVRERGFDPNSPLPLWDVRQAAVARRWTNFVQHPGDAVISLVREFYANLKCKHEQFHVLVRGKRVEFDGHTINTLYGMPSIDEDEYSAFKASDVDYDEIIATLCEEGA